MAYYNDNEHSIVTAADMPLYDDFDPLLVNLHDQLQTYAKDHTDENYGGLIDSVVSILDATLTDNERQMASDVLISLIEQATRDIRMNLAEKLAYRDDIQDSLLHYLAYNDIELAEPVLRHSPLLKDMDLIYVIQSKGRSHWRAIAKREGLSEQVSLSLVQKREKHTIIDLLNNEMITLPYSVLREILPVAKSERPVADTMADYLGLPKDTAVDLYWYVSMALRDHLVKKFDIVKEEIDTALEACMQDFADTVFQTNNMMPTTLMKEFAQNYCAQGKINDYMLIDVLRRRQGRFFIALFEKISGLSSSVIGKMMQQTGGQSMAVAARAMNIPKENFISIFLLSRKLTMAHKPVDSAELKIAIRYYDGLTHKIAKDILSDSIGKS